MDTNTNNTGLKFSCVLTLIFVILKLVGVIDWGWWLVISPILINIGALFFLAAIICIVILAQCSRCKRGNTNERNSCIQK